MPTVRTYVVTQTREVKVVATDPADAVKLGDAAFNGVTDSSVIHDTAKLEIRVTETTAREDY